MGIKNALQGYSEDQIRKIHERLQCLINIVNFDSLSSQKRTAQSGREKIKEQILNKQSTQLKIFFSSEGQKCQEQLLAETLCKEEALVKFGEAAMNN